MKKKNLIILLLIPFIISLLGIVTINVTFNIIDNDIVAIRWDYNDTEGFKVGSKNKLEAKGVSDSKYPVSMGNKLVWSVKNKDASDELIHASIVEEGNDYYLEAISVGEVIATCSNEKGNVFKNLNVIIYEDGAIIINPKIKNSQNNIDSMQYYGEYDLKDKNKVKANIEFDIKTVPSNLVDPRDVYIKDISNNISLSLETGNISVKQAGEAYVTLAHSKNKANDLTLRFIVVENGVNVYSYDDLLYCTNESSNGEIVVLRKSFESKNNILLVNDNNVEMFGKYDEVSKKYNFANEVYQFETTYNQEYIAQWNEFAKNSSEYKPITNQVLAALHVQKDFYGNGFTLNFHNLAYPYQTLKVDGGDGNMYDVPQLSLDNLFRGPLPFYTLGDPNGMPLITAFGQDNCGLYVDGNNIVINDVNVKNCDFGNSLSNLTYAGNVVDIHGNNITIKNSRLSNGKNVLRSFSSNNVSIDNCMLSNSRNFLIFTGSNEYEKVDGDTIKNFIDSTGNSVNKSAKDFLAAEAEGDQVVINYISGNYEDKDAMKKALHSIDDALNDESKVANKFKGSMNINNCLFYQSGISAIALESYFNGTYLFSKAPSLIGTMFSQMNYEDRPLVPLEPENISGISYPVKVNISGDTRFYDYKVLDTLDIGGLINENISAIANSIFDGNLRKITIDDIFPLKEILISSARSNNCIYNYDGKQYFNIPIAYYGGGLNLSEVTYDGFINDTTLGNVMPIDLLDNYIDLPSGDGLSTVQMMKYLMIKTVTTVTGYKPFKFVCTSNNSALIEETLNKAPNVSILIENAKGE